MAFNKAKAVQEAEQLAGQGKLGPAIDRYLAIIAKDPADLGLFNTAGDLCVRANNIGEALKLFRRLADSYAREGFALRAIAIHRKIAKLDPTALEPLLKLAELYSEQGLTREALKLYADALELAKSRNLNDEALDILRRIIVVDPENEAHRVRLAVCAEAMGRVQEAARVYVEAAEDAWRCGDRDSASGLLAKSAQLDAALPEIESLRARLSSAMTAGPAPAALPEVPPPAAPPASAGGEREPWRKRREAEAVESAELSGIPVGLALEPPSGAIGASLPAVARDETPAEPPEAASPEVEEPAWREFASQAPSWEFDLSSEWEALAAARVAAAETAVALTTPGGAFNEEESRAEIEFYLNSGLRNVAERSLATMEEKFPGHPQVAELRRLVEGATATVPQQPQPSGIAAAASASLGTTGNPLEQFAAELESGWAGLDQPGQSAPPVPIAQPSTAANEVTDALSGLLDELSSETELEATESPETHYSLGVAFREMGLHEEAIGEFQKVVKATRPDAAGSQFLQACSLLGVCFMDRHMPELAAKWYQRALAAPGLGDDARLALEYDLGIAWEKAGDSKAAMECFLEVYGQNIDYRDVAERIRLLQSGTA